MLAIITFFFNNIFTITFFVILIFALLIIFSIFNSDNNTNNNTNNTNNTKSLSRRNIEKIITIETFSGAGSSGLSDVLPAEKLETNKNKIVGNLPNQSFEETFCKEYEKKPHLLEQHCSKQSKNTCVPLDCCIIINGEKCVAGDKNGPIFHGTVDKPIHTEYYHHKNTCYPRKGTCPN